MTIPLPGQMTWKPDGNLDSTALHLRQNDLEAWQPYTAFPQYVLPDPPEFSAGYATFLALLKKNWHLV